MAEALQRQRQELEQHAFADSLTGLANRALFEDRVRHALGRSAGRDGRVAVLVLDLDGFKLVNDGLGHACGDELLRDAGERMAGVLRPSDTIARLGSDEFAVLLENVRGLDDALGPAERLRRVFREPFAVKDSEVMLTASIGIALSAGRRGTRRSCSAVPIWPCTGSSSAAATRASSSTRRWTIRRRAARDRQRAAPRDRPGQLVVHYQPILDLDTGEIRAAEALLRWNRPGHGLVPPLDFIPLAEQTGEIVALGAWVLNEACEEACRWIASGNASVPVTVNVSARQLVDPGFEGIVANALATSGLDSSGLILEVTESSVMQHAEVAVAKLRRISETGVRIALDDFGEGYSSLGQLRELPIDIVKIARPFVRELTENDRDPALVRGIIELARSLGLRLVAEGIEYPEQEAILRAFDCELGQGFLFARPLEAPGAARAAGRAPAPPFTAAPWAEPEQHARCGDCRRGAPRARGCSLRSGRAWRVGLQRAAARRSYLGPLDSWRSWGKRCTMDFEQYQSTMTIELSNRPIAQPEVDDIELAGVLHALSDPMRLRIVAALAETGASTCGSIDLPITKSTCTHHFRVLEGGRGDPAAARGDDADQLPAPGRPRGPLPWVASDDPRRGVAPRAGCGSPERTADRGPTARKQTAIVPSGDRPPARIRKRVYLPTKPRWRTKTSKRVPAASRRSRPRMRTGGRASVAKAGGGGSPPRGSGRLRPPPGGRHGEQPNQRPSRQQPPCDPHDGEGDHQKLRFVDGPRGARVGLRPGADRYAASKRADSRRWSS